jgi:TusA-related sulfurtransferase
MSPSRVNFGQIDPTAGTQQKTVKITRGDGGPLAPELSPSEHENVKASVREIEPGQQYEIDIEVSPPWPKRALSASLTLKTGVKESPEQIIRVYARMAPRLSAVEKRFQIPRDVKSDLDLKTRLKWSAGKSGNILEVTPSDPALSASITEEEGQQYVVLHVPAGYTPPEKTRPSVTVKTDDPLAPSLNIPVFVARPAPRLRVLPSRFTIQPNNASELEVKARLIWSGGTPGTILEATSSDPKTSVRVEKQDGQQYVVLHVPAGYAPPAGPPQSVTVKTSDSRAPTVRIPISVARASRTARLRALPARFTVPRDNQSERDLKVFLVWSGGKPGKILEATSSDPQTSVRVEEQDKRLYVLLHIPADYVPPSQPRPVVTLKTDDPQVPTLIIPVHSIRPTQTMQHRRPGEPGKPDAPRPVVSGKAKSAAPPPPKKPKP